MKKILIFFVLMLSILACEKKKNYEVYTKEQKEEIYNLALSEEEKGNTKKMEEIDKLLEKLEIETKKGDHTAEIELEEWETIINFTYKRNSFNFDVKIK